MSYNKYHAKPTVINNIRFDSQAEARRYQELLILAQVGQIQDLQVHPLFVLWECRNKTHKYKDRIEYEGDFAYTENGQKVVEDVKGVRTDIYRLKIKMFLDRYPEIKFVELKA